MIRQIVPLFFTTNIPATLVYYKDKLGSECLGAWQEPPVNAVVVRDHYAIHFRCAEPPPANPDKYSDELLHAYLHVEDADALYGIRSPGCGVHSGSCRHAMEITRDCGEGL